MPPLGYYMIVDQVHVKVFFSLCNPELGKYRIEGSVLVIRGQLYLLSPFRVLVVRVDIGTRLISERYRCTTYIYLTAVRKN